MKKRGDLKKILFESGLSQRQLSRKTGIPESYLSMYVQGRMLLRREEKELIAGVLNLRVDELFGGQST